MSRQKKSGRKHPSTSLADVTINDFANSSVCKNRIKKSTANVTNVLRQLEDQKSWDEKDDDLDGDFVEQENEDGTVSYVIQKTEPRRRRKTGSSCSEDKKLESNGNEYPLDVWFMISEYIRPEDIGRFAGICKTSYEVVGTAKFWFSLYKRHYKTITHLPERLQPECLFRKYGLRTSVIRALHFMYEPFVNRLKSIEQNEQHPDLLKRTQCVLMWHRKVKRQCLYYFKMKRNQRATQRHGKTDGLKPDLLEMLDDIYANQEDGCRILQVTCKQLIPINPVLGLTLASAQLNLCTELRYHKLLLWFGSEIQTGNPSTGGNGNTLIILEPVINVKVLDWWHPLYPHVHNMEHLFSQE